MASHPLESYKYQGVDDCDFQEEPVAEFLDADNYGTALDLAQLDDAIAFCKRYGFKWDHFKPARTELAEITDIFNRMHDEDAIPIQR